MSKQFVESAACKTGTQIFVGQIVIADCGTARLYRVDELYVPTRGSRKPEPKAKLTHVTLVDGVWRTAAGAHTIYWAARRVTPYEAAVAAEAKPLVRREICDGCGDAFPEAEVKLVYLREDSDRKVPACASCRERFLKAQPLTQGQQEINATRDHLLWLNGFENLWALAIDEDRERSRKAQPTGVEYARCSCYRGHNSSSGRCNARNGHDGVLLHGGAVVCPDCARDCKA